MSTPHIRKNFHERPQLVVTCACTRVMHQQAHLGPDAYRCGCGRTVSVTAPLLVQETDQSCGVLLEGGGRCGRHVRNAVATVGGVCDDCLNVLVNNAVLDPMRRDKLLKLFTAGEVDQARIDRDRAAAQREQERAQVAAQRRAEQREADAVHVVYYVRTGERTIKIGTTGHLAERMRAFRVANPDNLLAAEPGSYDIETQRHQQFRAWRYHRRREDFGDADELLEHIAAVREEHGDPWTVGAAR